MTPFWKRWYRLWLARRLPPASVITLNQRRIFILPTGYGWLFLALSLLLFIGGINYQNNLIMGFSFLLFAVFCVAIWHTFRNLSGLRLEVVDMRPAFVGELGQIGLQLSGRAAHLGIRLYWQADAAEQVSLHVGEAANLLLAVSLKRRGWNRLGRLQVESRFPLGLLRSWSRLDMDCACLAWPQPLPGGECPASGGDEQPGMALARGRDEFAGLRDYVPGDGLHYIDWKAFARGHGLKVRDFSGAGGGKRLLEFEWLAGVPVEERLSRLCYWAQQLELSGQAWGLVLPHQRLAPSRGRAHLTQALTLLGSFGEPAP